MADGLDAVGLGCDIANPAAVRALLGLLGPLARVGVLVCAAGVMSERSAKTLRTNDKEWRGVMTVTSTARTERQLLPGATGRLERSGATCRRVATRTFQSWRFTSGRAVRTGQRGSPIGLCCGFGRGHVLWRGWAKGVPCRTWGAPRRLTTRDVVRTWRRRGQPFSYGELWMCRAYAGRRRGSLLRS